MKILKLMKCNPKVISPESNLTEAAHLMRNIDAGVLPVVENKRVIGMITDRDITIRAISKGMDPNATSVREIMTPEAICCYSDENIHEAGKAMMDSKVGRLPVLNRRNLNLAGIVTLADIIKQCGGKALVKGSSLPKAKYAIPAALALAALGAFASRSLSHKTQAA